jgi:hypothetical protein
VSCGGIGEDVGCADVGEHTPGVRESTGGAGDGEHAPGIRKAVGRADAGAQRGRCRGRRRTGSSSSAGSERGTFAGCSEQADERNGNVISSNVTCLEVMTRLVLRS